MKKNIRFNLSNNGKKPEIEINKTTGEKFWQRPYFNFWLFVIFILISLYFYQGLQQVRQQ